MEVLGIKFYQPMIILAILTLLVPFSYSIDENTKEFSIKEFEISKINDYSVSVNFNSSNKLDSIIFDSNNDIFVQGFSTNQSESPFHYQSKIYLFDEGNTRIETYVIRDIYGNVLNNTYRGNITTNPTVQEFKVYDDKEKISILLVSENELNKLNVELAEDYSGSLNISDFRKQSFIDASDSKKSFRYEASISKNAEIFRIDKIEAYTNDDQILMELNYSRKYEVDPNSLSKYAELIKKISKNLGNIFAWFN